MSNYHSRVIVVNVINDFGVNARVGNSDLNIVDLNAPKKENIHTEEAKKRSFVDAATDSSSTILVKTLPPRVRG